MRKVVIAFFLTLTVVAASQDQKPEIVLRPSGPVPRWDRGEVEGRTYRNTSVGIELSPPPGLELGSPELKGNPGTLPLLVTITAVGEDKLHPARSKVMAFYTDALAYYPSTRRSTDAYMLRVVRSQQGDGYESVERASTKLGGIVFERQDFKKGDVYESVLVKACDVQALVFIFGGADQETVNSVIAATELKLNPVTSGCISNATSRVQK
jgi:hypothetical protein